jgi:hypothetical protein
MIPKQHGLHPRTGNATGRSLHAPSVSSDVESELVFFKRQIPEEILITGKVEISHTVFFLASWDNGQFLDNQGVLQVKHAALPGIQFLYARYEALFKSRFVHTLICPPESSRITGNRTKATPVVTRYLKMTQLLKKEVLLVYIYPRENCLVVYGPQ